MGSQSRTSDPIPLVHEVAHIYSKERLVKEDARWVNLQKQFNQRFGSEPQYIARAPGRVNLIGDHVDHMRFSCMPAALEMDILMAFRVHTNSSRPSSSCASSSVQFHLENTSTNFKGTMFRCSLKGLDCVGLEHSGPHRWANYFKVAYRGLLPHLPKAAFETCPSEVQVLIDGTIPPESSLSSSAAMTTCSSIVILQSFQSREEISRREMAEVAIESERLVGVNSGGMDQAASIFGTEGCALLVSFVPQLSATATHFPITHPPHLFVIANTLVTSDKKVNGPIQYNLRVGELWMACRAICKKLSLPQDKSTKVLKDLLEVYFDKNALQLQNEDEKVQKVCDRLGEEAAKIVKMQQVALSCLPEHPLSRHEVEELTGYRGNDFDQEFLSDFPIRAETYKLHARTKHVLAESLRVLAFQAQCHKTCTDPASSYNQLGQIMHESRESLFNDYENGCPELQEVCSIANAHGALGSRPTGAGWGGSTVSLVEQSKVDQVLKALRREYYEKRNKDITDDQFQDAVLVSQPAAGACLFQV